MALDKFIFIVIFQFLSYCILEYKNEIIHGNYHFLKGHLEISGSFFPYMSVSEVCTDLRGPGSRVLNLC